MPTVYIALGSNVGDRLANLQEAIDRLKQHLKIQAVSRVYETEPMYVVDQPPFFNAAIKASTELPPVVLLALLKQTEKEVGRQTRERYGPREVDLDLIAYGGLEYAFTSGRKKILELPHPKTGERRFVLQPLFDLDPSLSLPSIGQVKDLLLNTEEQAAGIRRRDDAVLSL